MLARLMAWSDGYYRSALIDGAAACLICGARALLRHHLPDVAPAAARQTRGLHLYCERCRAPTSWATVRALALLLPAGRSFWREHPRIRTLPPRAITVAGRAALLLTFVSVTGAAQLDVAFADDTYEVLGVHGVPGA